MNKTTLRLTLCLAIGLVVFVVIQAGSLEPPAGIPGPTMFTLSQLFNGVMVKTGQVIEYEPGDDGDIGAGVNVVGNRFITENGKFIDRVTLLVWTEDANCFAGQQTWSNALNDANTLNGNNNPICFPSLNDNSLSGAWRLPNKNELSSLINYEFTDKVFQDADPGAADGQYWTSTTYSRGTTLAWAIGTIDGADVAGGKNTSAWVWPVRDYDPGLDGPL